MTHHQKYDPNKISEEFQINNRIGRACKGGIEYTTRNGNDIYFVLDELDIEWAIRDVIFPSPLMGKSITGREIRWVYRNRENPEVKDHVKFVRDNEIVSTPWETDKKPWQVYDIYLEKKHSGGNNLKLD